MTAHASFTRPHCKPLYVYSSPTRPHCKPLYVYPSPTRPHCKPIYVYPSPTRPHCKPLYVFSSPTRPHCKPIYVYPSPTRPHFAGHILQTAPALLSRKTNFRFYTSSPGALSASYTQLQHRPMPIQAPNHPFNETNTLTYPTHAVATRNIPFVCSAACTF